jgi:hypothetical protein
MENTIREFCSPTLLENADELDLQSMADIRYQAGQPFLVPLTPEIAPRFVQNDCRPVAGLL